MAVSLNPPDLPTGGLSSSSPIEEVFAAILENTELSSIEDVDNSLMVKKWSEAVKAHMVFTYGLRFFLPVLIRDSILLE